MAFGGLGLKLGVGVWGWGGGVLGACRLRFGAGVCDSGLGAGGAVWGGRKFTVLAGVWGLRREFAARGLQLAVWRLRFEVGIRGMGLVRDSGNWGLGAGAQFWED